MSWQERFHHCTMLSISTPPADKDRPAFAEPGEHGLLGESGTICPVGRESARCYRDKRRYMPDGKANEGKGYAACISNPSGGSLERPQNYSSPSRLNPLAVVLLSPCAPLEADPAGLTGEPKHSESSHMSKSKPADSGGSTAAAAAGDVGTDSSCACIRFTWPSMASTSSPS